MEMQVFLDRYRTSLVTPGEQGCVGKMGLRERHGKSINIEEVQHACGRSVMFSPG